LGAQAHQPLGIGEKFESLLRRRDAAAIALDQADAEEVLELRNAHRYRRLRGVELLGGAAERAQGRDPHEGLERFEIDHAARPLAADKATLSDTIQKHDWTG